MCQHLKQSASASFCRMPRIDPPGIISYFMFCDSCGEKLAFLDVERYYPDPKDLINNGTKNTQQTRKSVFKG